MIGSTLRHASLTGPGVAVVVASEEEEEAATGTLDLSPAAEGAVTAVPSQGADTVGRARGRAPVTLRVAVATAVDRAPVKLGSNSADICKPTSGCFLQGVVIPQAVAVIQARVQVDLKLMGG